MLLKKHVRNRVGISFGVGQYLFFNATGFEAIFKRAI